MKRNKLKRLLDKDYRDAYVSAHVDQGLAFQIKALREQRGWTQLELANKMGLKSQSAVGRCEDPSYGKLSLAKLKDLARVFDVGLLVRFVPYSRFLTEVCDTSDKALSAKSFEVELPVLSEDCETLGQYHLWHWKNQFDVENDIEVCADVDIDNGYSTMVKVSMSSIKDSGYVVN